MKHRHIDHWFLQGPGWLLVFYLVYAQAVPAFDYQLGVAMGTQEPVSSVTEVGVAFWQGFSIGDLLVYLPLLTLGLIGYGLGKRWGRVALAAALGITIYWPVVCLAVIVAARDAVGWNLGDETAYWTMLPTIVLWGAWGLWHIAGQSSQTRSS